MAIQPIDERELKTFCEDVTKKSVPAVDEPKLVKEFLKYIQMHNEFMLTSSAYEIASTIRSYNTWYLNKDLSPRSAWVSPREVFYVDLGAFNLKYEEGYIHPCVVIKKYGSSVFVIPGSSKKYGKGNDLIFDIQAGDGFSENTGLLLDQIRCVSSTRLISKLSQVKVPKPIFDNIIDKIMEKFFNEKFQKIANLNKDKVKLQEQLDLSGEEITKLTEEINNLKEQLEIYKEIYKNSQLEAYKNITKIEKEA